MDARPLIYWAKERESIRRKKEEGLPRPWTEDPILDTYRFTNVCRRDDRVSQWLINNVLNEAPQLRPWDIAPFFLFTALCRWINWPPTIKELIDGGYWPVPGVWGESRTLDFNGIVRKLDQISKSGSKVWTGAYMIRAKPASKRSKAHFVVHEVIERSLTPVLKGLYAACSGKSAEGVWEILVSRPNWGSFMAGQLVADWSYTHFLADAEDIYTWAPKGPGSIRGLNRLRGSPLNAPIPDEVWRSGLLDLRHQMLAALGPGYDTLTMMDVQNCLCEVDKYLRVEAGEGRPRSKYEPETAY